MDFKRIFGASTVVILVGLLIMVLSIVAQILPSLITSGPLDQIKMVSTGFAYLSLLLFALLYMWGGLRASKKLRAEPQEAGLVSAFSYAVVAFLQLIINGVFSVLLVNRMATIGGFRAPESIYASTLLGDMSGMSGIVISGICGLGVIVLGMMVNFVLGAGCAMIFNRQR